MTKEKVAPPNGKPKIVEKKIEKKKSVPRNNIHLSKEEVEVILPSLDALSFTANTTNFEEVGKMIKLIRDLKSKLKELQ